MILWLLLALATTVHGASIPPQPVIPTASACLQGCFSTGSIVNAAFDLLNFRSIAVDIENFCNFNSALLKCGRECPAEQIPELEARTHASSYICNNKIEEFRLVSACLEGADDVTSVCASECGISTDVPFRLDSSPAASVNPAVFLDGVAGTCKKEICVLRCSQKGLNKECAGAGDLFKDMAKQQVSSGIETLTEASSDENATTIHFMAENYLKNLPSECAFLKDIDEFEEVMKPEESSTQAATTEPSSTSSSEQTTAEGVLEKDEELATIDFMKEATPKMVEEEPVETVNTPVAHDEEPTTMAPVQEGDSASESNSDATSHVTIPLPDLHEEEEVVKSLDETTPVAEVTEAQSRETTDEEVKGDIGMDVNAIEVTSPAPTEPVIVVDDIPSDVDENRVQVGTKQEVKSNSAATVVLSSLFAVGAALLLL
uniref:Uncharacterized protein n=1 Tax=Haemonchus contortus TaxID=6289 RepID=A0A7I4YRL1_HAECO